MWKTSMIAVFVSVAAFAACGGNSKEKGGGAKGSGAANSNQMTGGTAQQNKGKGTGQGQTYEGVTCDSSTDGLAWCDTDVDIAFCSDGQWWLLDCSDPAIGGDFCGDDGSTIDCYAASDF